GLTEEQIKEDVEKEFSLRNFPPEVLEKILEDLLESRKIQAVLINGEKYYILTEDSRNRLNLIFSEFNRVQSLALKQIISHVKSAYQLPLSNTQIAIIKSNFFNILGQLFGYYGTQLARMIFQERFLLSPSFLSGMQNSIASSFDRKK
ncbi:MAG: hypothetical protein QXR84_08100, partial [Candidatus Bathyarchaeia archaeon]